MEAPNITERSLHMANEFVISCGTVTLDIKNYKVLLIRDRKTNEVYLPKGRKNMDETLHQAAIRETYEETGVTARLLRLRVPTLATLPGDAPIKRKSKKLKPPSDEPIAVSQRVTDGILKIIFWYVAAADSTIPPEEGTQDAGEDFETLWTCLDEAESVLTFDDERRVAQLGIGVEQATASAR